ncbi:phage holin family protein [Streptococcus sp. E17BB]|uniref:phage holin family protein n=1 Tax=Streptococcus sp. E17BB TaxID=3278714 RepID=UPI00359EBA78
MNNLPDLTWSQHLRALADTDDKKILFVLTLILGAMIIDFLLGVTAAKINPNIQFRSKEGINGILRKIASIALLAYCIPLSVILPDGIGFAALQVLYLGYLFFELKSIVENLEKLGVNAALFRVFIAKLSQHLANNTPSENKEDKDNEH